MADDEVRVHFVKVTNGLPFDIEDRHDGIPYRIKAGQTTTVPLDAAFHMYHYVYPGDRGTMLRHVSRRLGWNTPEFALPDPKTGRTKAQDFFDKIKIDPVMFKMVEVQPDEPEKPVPADPAPDEPEPPPPAARAKTPRRVEFST